MSKTVFVIVVLFVGSLFAASPIQAATLTLDEQPTYSGLTFTSPLQFISSPKIKYNQLSFANIKNPTQVIITRNKTVIVPSPTPTPTAPLVSVKSLVNDAVVSLTLKIPSPTVVSISPSPEPVRVQSWGLDAEKLFAMSNTYRASKGLAPLQKDERACQLASSRAPEIGEEIMNGHMHSGLRNRNLPYWNTENIISMRSEEEAFTWWINDRIHREAIEGNYIYSCVACAGNSCAQEFTNFQMK